MNIPSRLKIGGHEYKVIYPYHFTERGDRTGDHDGDHKQIRIDDRDSYSHELRPESAVAVTFLHELLHAADYTSGHGIFLDNEKAIEGISEVLFQILRDNRLDFSSLKEMI